MAETEYEPNFVVQHDVRVRLGRFEQEHVERIARTLDRVENKMARIENKLDQLIVTENAEVLEMGVALERITAGVTKLQDAEQAGIKLIQNLVNAMRQNAADEQAMLQLADTAERQAAEMMAAVVANTPADPANTGTGDTTGGTGGTAGTDTGASTGTGTTDTGTGAPSGDTGTTTGNTGGDNTGGALPGV